MDFQTAIKTCFNKYAVFEGRASRSEYWFFLLGTVLVAFAAGIIDTAIFGSSKKILSLIWNLITILPLLAAMVRRLHDTDRSGWLLLYYDIILVLFIGILVGIVALIPYKDASDGAIGIAIGIGAIGFIVASGIVIYFLSLPGTQGPNQYGDDPLVSASQDAGQVNYRASKTHEQNRTTTDNLALLERLYDLRQKAILTDAEFEQQKKRILAG
ncbi:MAG: DUF805 domain-containing protein [Pseudomonadota bacterium]|nr:DUF805 domain-containing protein [Pseudomonadota bacterium]